MGALNRRLTKLEKASLDTEAAIPRIVFLDGTRKEVEARMDELEDKLTIVVTPSPHIGETMNEARASSGLKPLDIPGWDAPRVT